jgi:hypothetical protein
MKKPTVVHPILFAIFPAWFLYSRNTEQVSIGEVFLPMIVFIVLALIVWAILRLLLGNGIKAGLVTSLLILLNFSYGHIYSLMGRIGLWAHNIGTHRQLVPVVIILFAISFFLVWRTKAKLWRLTGILNGISVFMIAIPAVAIVYSLAFQSGDYHRAKVDDIHIEVPSSPPDIYYIILDGYGRADILADMYGFDNSEFLDYLSKNGFFVAEKSRSNYAQTYLSLASSLNFTYLESLAERPVSLFRRARILIDMVKKSRISKILKENGYSTVAFSTGYSGTEIRNVDFFYSPRWALSEFQAVLISGTLADVLMHKILARTSISYDLHRQRILYTLKEIPDAAETGAPVFVLAHVLAPHPPFVFDEKGQPLNPEWNYGLIDGSHFMIHGTRDQYVESYKAQITYINSLVETMIDSILAGSTVPPVIILQGDHGPGSRLDWSDAHNTDFHERMSILNAIHIPGANSTGLYNEMTPVNTFRVVLDDLFGADLPILRDRSYFSIMAAPFDFIDVTGQTAAGSRSGESPGQD